MYRRYKHIGGFLSSLFVLSKLKCLQKFVTLINVQVPALVIELIGGG